MIRIAAYILLTWGLMALVGGLAEVANITIMIPATTAVMVAHVGFSEATPLPMALGLAVVFGYLEDLHQGAPVGTLALSCAVTLLLMRWLSRRVSAETWLVRALVSALAVTLIDLVTFGVLWTLSDAFQVDRSALVTALWDVRFHALATALVAPVVWSLSDRFFAALRLEDRPPQHTHWVSS